MTANKLAVCWNLSIEREAPQTFPFVSAKGNLSLAK